MTKRTSTTIVAQVRLRIPAGGNVNEAVEFIRTAINDRQDKLREFSPSAPMASLATQEVIVKLVERKTTYI